MREGFDLDEELKKLPHKPGVYVMYDEQDVILYVGKAVDLHNRVRSYFRANIGRGPWIDRMVSMISYFEIIITDSELEALVLENNLIKENHPKYNTMLMDDKTYPFIKVTLGEEYPRVVFSRDMKKDKSRYFGPYTSAASVKDTIELVNTLFRLRTCRNNVTNGVKTKDRPCLNYHMGRCMAPCQGNVPVEEYADQLREALEFLDGRYDDILKDLEKRMQEASEEMNFEKAAHIRDLMASVRACVQKQKITDSGQSDRDILAIAEEGENAVAQVFFIRSGKMIGREHFFMKVTEDDLAVHIGDFIKQYYVGTPYIPREIFVQCKIDEAGVIEDWLSSKREGRVYIVAPKKGQKEKLVELAYKNALQVLKQDSERALREEKRTLGAVKEIGDILGIEGISRVEAFDISNISGFENVGSMVVFEKGKPKKSDYRKFKIKTVAGPDDYACMREVMTRRMSHGGYPDLFLMDGGRGQVNIALEVLKEFGLDIPVCGMVKDDHHRTRGLYYDNKELPIDRNSEGFKLITRIQDEAHRFAITYHRSLRSKDQVHSILDDIPGVGPGRRKILMKHFESIDELKDAGIDRLASIDGIPRNIAEEIHSFFHSDMVE
ncbi:MAG: excinuclease ABC subunit UvrC [Lachnospiraceae bacterium]|nr:excinuclease ABC subunit UvrC [Lachnospiraceae bacterium]